MKKIIRIGFVIYITTVVTLLTVVGILYSIQSLL